MVGKLSGTSIPGSVFFIGLLIVAGIGISYISIDWGPLNSPDIVRSVKLHQEYYTMENSLGLARLYLDTSLRYSVYQAMYDLGWNGGFSQIPEENLYNTYALWYDNQDINPDEQAVLDNLSSASLANLNKYLRDDYVFLDDYKVKLPGYGLGISKTPNGLEVNATSNKNLWIREVMQNLDTIELEKDADLQEGFDTNYLGLFQRGGEKLGEIKEKFGSAKALLGSIKTGSLTREGESRPQITQLEVFRKVLGDAGISDAESREEGEAMLRERMGGILSELRDQAGETVIKFEAIVSFIVGSFRQEDCTSQESQREEEGRTLYKTTLTCSFKYNYDLFVKASLTDNSGKRYPVFDREKEEVSFRPLTLLFAARERSE